MLLPWRRGITDVQKKAVVFINENDRLIQALSILPDGDPVF